MSLCQCKEPDIYVEGNTTNYYACMKCRKPVADVQVKWHVLKDPLYKKPSKSRKLKVVK